MSYEFKRTARVVEQIKMGDQVLSVNLDAEHIAIEFNKRRNAIIQAERDIKQLQADGTTDETVLAKYGEAVIALFQLVFGDENTEKIVAFYEGRYLEMAVEIFPFILNVITPQIRAAIVAMQKVAASQYKQNQRSLFGRKKG